MLSNISHLEPIVPNETRWNGISEILNRYNRIRDDLVYGSFENGNNEINKEASVKLKTYPMEKCLQS